MKAILDFTVSVQQRMGTEKCYLLSNVFIVLFCSTFHKLILILNFFRLLILLDPYTPNANMADHSVVARDELHESEVSQSLMFCFDNASPEKSSFVLDLFCFISLCLRVAVFLNATRKDRNLPPFTSKRK